MTAPERPTVNEEEHAVLGSDSATEVVRHEEEVSVEKESADAGAIHARKLVETGRIEQVVPRDIEEADVERTLPAERDSGKIETLPDGSVSIPIFEEEIVVTKRTVVRERVIIRKRTHTEHHRIEADVRRERLEIDADEGVLDDEPDAGR